MALGKDHRVPHRPCMSHTGQAQQEGRKAGFDVANTALDHKEEDAGHGQHDRDGLGGTDGIAPARERYGHRHRFGSFAGASRRMMAMRSSTRPTTMALTPTMVKPMMGNPVKARPVPVAVPAAPVTTGPGPPVTYIQ